MNVVKPACPQIASKPRHAFLLKVTLLGIKPPIYRRIVVPTTITLLWSEVTAAPFTFESPGWTTLDFGPIVLALHILQTGPKEPEARLPHADPDLEVDSMEAMQALIDSPGGELIEHREPSGGVPVRVAAYRDCEVSGFELRQVP